MEHHNAKSEVVSAVVSLVVGFLVIWKLTDILVWFFSHLAWVE